MPIDGSSSPNAAKPNVVCRCLSEIPENEIEYYNGCNEEGEDYAVVTGHCPNCKVEYETSQWGEWDNKEDAFQYLNNYIKNGE